MAPNDTTRDRLILTAMDLFHAQGFEATGIAQITKEANVHGGSLYHFFKTKEALLLAVLDKYESLLWPVVMGPAFERSRDPIERIFSILEFYRHGLEVTEFKRGCPIGNIALELSDWHPDVRKRVAELFEMWKGAVRQCLEDAGDRLPASADKARLASFVLTVMEGAVMQTRACHDFAPFDAAIEDLRNYFAHLELAAQAEARMGVNRVSNPER